jgi:non-haem dioxygenase in morphine synthesis N-terminal
LSDSTASPPAMSLSLPIIDLSSYFEPSKFSDSDREVASRSLHNACRFFGFFYLKLEGFATEEEMAELTDLGRAFFHLEQEKKDEIRLANEDGARGYQRLKENVTMGKADVSLFPVYVSASILMSDRIMKGLISTNPLQNRTRASLFGERINGQSTYLDSGKGLKLGSARCIYWA